MLMALKRYRGPFRKENRVGGGGAGKREQPRPDPVQPVKPRPKIGNPLFKGKIFIRTIGSSANAARTGARILEDPHVIRAINTAGRDGLVHVTKGPWENTVFKLQAVKGGYELVVG